MNQKPALQFSPSVVLLPLFSVLTLWVIFWLDTRWHFNFDTFGIYPRTLYGLKGIFFSPFLHANIEHLYNNSIPIFVLTAALQFFYREHSFKVLFFGILLSGFLTWIIGRPSYHIGVSSVIYVLVSFIFFKGIYTKHFRLIALSLFVVTFYGSTIWYIFPNVQEGISWEGHLSGLITGFVFALIFKTPDYVKTYKYDWERPDFDPTGDKFLERFDENGNFVNLPPPIPEDEELEPQSHTYFSSHQNVSYIFIPKDNYDNNSE